VISTWSHYLILHLLWMVNERVTWRLLSILTLTWTVTVTEAHLTVFLLMTVILIWICLEILMLVTHCFEQTSYHLHCHSWERTLYLLPYCVIFHYQSHSLLPCPVQLHLKRLPLQQKQTCDRKQKLCVCQFYDKMYQSKERFRILKFCIKWNFNQLKIIQVIWMKDQIH